MNICRYHILNCRPQDFVPSLAPLLDTPSGEPSACSSNRLVRLAASPASSFYARLLVHHRFSSFSRFLCTDCVNCSKSYI